ncbi:MAG: hypothetical protein HYY42_05255 [Chloroflexi bacterium]|nr:hypothetical protein [Chloroflexota bacterium]
MTPVRVPVVILARILGATLAVGTWGQPPGATGRLSDDDYISIALSDPQVFRPTGPGSGKSVQPERVDRSGAVVTVDLTVDGIRFRVLIDPRTNRITQVLRR